LESSGCCHGSAVVLPFFIAHLFFPGPDSRLLFSFIYLGLAAVLLIADRGRIVEMYHRAMSVFNLNAFRRDHKI
jgi:hypothetical protein